MTEAARRRSHPFGTKNRYPVISRIITAERSKATLTHSLGGLGASPPPAYHRKNKVAEIITATSKLKRVTSCPRACTDISKGFKTQSQFAKYP
jgi:hypothetical protein